MKTFSTKDAQQKPPLVMLVYGEGGVGKTTFAATAPKPFIADAEGGTKYLGKRGIELSGAHIEKWLDMKEFMAYVLDPKNGVETVVLDPIGELLEKLKRHMIAQADPKLVQKDGAPTMAGWGYVKDGIRAVVKTLRDSGKNVLIIAHLDEKKDEDRIVKRPLIQTTVAQELVNAVDVVGFFTKVRVDDEVKRVILVDTETDKYVAKDRTESLGKVVPPNFTDLLKATQGDNSFSWVKK